MDALCASLAEVICAAARRRRRAALSRSAARACSPIRRRTFAVADGAPRPRLRLPQRAHRPRAASGAVKSHRRGADRRGAQPFRAAVRQPAARHHPADRRGRAGVRRQAQQPASAVRGPVADHARPGHHRRARRRAARRREARASRCATSRSAIPEMTIEDGYAIQRAWVQLKLAEGRVVKGHKIGLTSRAMQQAVADHRARLRAAARRHVLRRRAATFRSSRFIAPRVEVELAFILGRPLQGAGRDARSTCSRRPSYVTPAIEIIDARIEQFDRETKAPRKVFDTIADFAANAGIVARRPAGAAATTSTCAGSARCSTRTA